MKSDNPFAEYGEDPLQKQILHKIEELGRIIAMMHGTDFGLVLPRNVYDSMGLYISHGSTEPGYKQYSMHTPSGICKLHTANDVELLPPFLRTPADPLNPVDMVAQIDYYKTKELEFLRENIGLKKELAIAKKRIEELEGK